MSPTLPPEVDADEGMTASTAVQDVLLDFGEDSMWVCSALLRLTSPVFHRMLESGMAETQQRIIKVDMVNKAHFELFYGLLGPLSWSPEKVTEANVDALLVVSDYYQVRIIKQTCEDLLLRLPATARRLLQANQHGLQRQLRRCVDSLALTSTKEDSWLASIFFHSANLYRCAS